jgi:hypothetical protein
VPGKLSDHLDLERLSAQRPRPESGEAADIRSEVRPHSGFLEHCDEIVDA